MKISVCIPMYNESSVCCQCARTLYRAMEKTENEADFEIVFCDDGSTDGTANKLRKYVEDHKWDRITVCGYEKNQGKGAAVREAVAHTTGDCVIYTDCDLAYGTELILPAAKKVASGAGMVVGTRNRTREGYGKYPFMRRLASKAYIKALSLMAGLSVSDSQCGFKALEGDVARKAFSLCTVNGFSFDLEVIMIVSKMQVNICEIPVSVVNHRDSKIRLFSDAVSMLKDVVKIKKRVRELEVQKNDP